MGLLLASSSILLCCDCEEDRNMIIIVQNVFPFDSSSFPKLNIIIIVVPPPHRSRATMTYAQTNAPLIIHFSPSYLIPCSSGMSPGQVRTDVRGRGARPVLEVARDLPTTADPARVGGPPEDLR